MRTCVSLMFALLACSCGVGTAALVGALAGSNSSGGSSVSTVTPAVVSDVQPTTGGSTMKTSPLTFQFRLTDQESDPADVDVNYCQAGGGEVPLVLSGNTNLDLLATSPAGVVHERDWDFAGQLGSTSLMPSIRLVVRLSDDSGSSTSQPFDVGNDPPVVSLLGTPAGEFSQVVSVPLDLSDSSGDLVTILVEYDNLDDPLGWHPATALGIPLVDMAATPGGVLIEFLWDVLADAPGLDFRARLRFTPIDPVDAGVAIETADLQLDNNGEPLVVLNGSAFFANPDKRRGIPLPFDVIDPEGDPVQVVFQWRRPNEVFPDLPDDPTSLDAILASDVARFQHQIATESSSAYLGRIHVATPATARLSEVAESGLLSEFIVGRRIEVLRAGRTPEFVASGWAANPLSNPRWVLPLGDGNSAFVLDSPAAGAWRVQEVDFATGSVLGVLASGVDGDANALAIETSATLLLATDVAGTWSIRRVALADGTVSPLITTGGAIATGDVRGLVVLSGQEVLITVGNALISVEDLPPAPSEIALVTDLQSAWGLAPDPRHPHRVYVAERDWLNPDTSEVEGRVILFDLQTRSRTPVVAIGPPLTRPSSIALEGDGLLLALTDADGGDGALEIRAVRLEGASGGSSHEVLAGLPPDSRALATGADRLRVLCVPSQNNLALSGGLQQVSAITSFDLASHDATVDPPFDPVPGPGQTWRIEDRSATLPAGQSVRKDTFLWDSRDALAAGEVILRAFAYDTERGQSTDTGLPRKVLSGIDVLPLAIGGSSLTDGASSVTAADLNGDGALDLASSNSLGDSLTVFFQAAPGLFPSAPDVTIQGIPVLAPMLEPASLVAADVDANGTLDLVSANPGSDDLSVVRQVTPGIFTAGLLRLGLGTIMDPLSVAAADLNGDGATDLISANAGSNDVAVFFQLVGGMYNPTPSLLLGDATTLGPSDVAVGDVDSDTDLDIVLACSASHNLAVFLQTAPGTFSATPSFLLGGPGTTDGPAAVVAGDFDGDGRTDLASANRDGNSLTVFLQGDSGFPPAPTFTLAAFEGPVQPRDLVAGDVNGDGALDLLSTNANNEVTAYLFVPEEGVFDPEPLVLTGDGNLQGPAGAVVADLDGDALTDLAVAQDLGHEIAIFLQSAPPGFLKPQPDVVLGSALQSPAVSAVAVSDLNGDTYPDIVCASEGNDTVVVYQQVGPGVIGTEPAYVLGGPGTTAGVRSVATADLNSDGRVDLLTANGAAGNLALFFQAAGGSLSTTPDTLLGTGVLNAPAWGTAADLDGDGDSDIACADSAGDQIAVFLQTGGFSVIPDAILGGASITDGPVMVVASDLNLDGRLDLLSANSLGNTLSVFFQSPGGSFNLVPDLTLGGPGETDTPRAVATADVDDDGDEDVVSVNESSDEITLFLASAPGVLPSVPSIRLSDAAVQQPTSLFVTDVDGDGLQEIICGYSGSGNLAVFFQESPATFTATPTTFGASGFTDSPGGLVVVDLDRDGDLDVVSAQPDLDNVPIFFGGH